MRFAVAGDAHASPEHQARNDALVARHLDDEFRIVSRASIPPIVADGRRCLGHRCEQRRERFNASSALSVSAARSVTTRFPLETVFLPEALPILNQNAIFSVVPPVL